MSNCERRRKLRAFALAFRPLPAVVLPKWRVVFLAFGSFFLPFFRRDFRLKKRSKCPSWRSPALSRTRCQGRGFCVHRSEVQSLDRKSGRESALLRQEGQEKRSFFVEIQTLERAISTISTGLRLISDLRRAGEAITK